MKIYRLAIDFDAWFSGSQVVDQNGNPQPVYHGTNQTIDKFDASKLGYNTKAVSAYDGFFFTEEKSEAVEYADLSASLQVEDASAHEQKEQDFLKKMEDASKSQNWVLYEQLNIELEELSLNAIRTDSGQRYYVVYLAAKNPMTYTAVEGKPTGEVSDMIQFAKESGYDSVRLEGVQDGFHKPTNHWVVFSPSQIRIVEEVRLDGGE